MGSIRRNLTKATKAKENEWEEFVLTDDEAAFVKTIINTRNIVNNSYDEMVGRFLGASLVPRIGKVGSMQFDLNPEDPEHKVRVKPADIPTEP